MTISSNNGILVVLCCLLLSFGLYHFVSSRRHPPFPPGPRALPLLGNLFDIPVAHEYLTFQKWAQKYGDTVHVNALGTHIVILNSVDAAQELLSGRSAIYSDRPFIPMLHDPSLMNSNRSFAFKRYSAEWRRQRRLFTRHIGPAASREFFVTLTLSSHTLLRSILHTPRDFFTHLRYATAEGTLGIAYGYKIQPKDDPLVALAESAGDIVLEGALPARFLVNVFPWLKYLPAWFPGTGFKAFAARGREAEEKIVEMSYKDAKRRIEEGTASPSFITNALSDLSSTDSVADIQGVALTMYAGAFDTTVSTIHSCILALVLYPTIQQRAHAELDTVLGPVTSPTFRLPTFADRPHLPYLDAIVNESLRWLPVAPMGGPHATTEEDIYRGWRIPKGTIVLANAWSMLHDETIYPDPLTFRPERFLGDKTAPHPASRGCFGFGRRECPGRHLAEAALWIQIASLLAVFTFSPAKDANGQDIDVTYARRPSVGLFLHPQHFPCTIAPRSNEAEMRIDETQSVRDQSVT